jgi:hypothetical protein
MRAADDRGVVSGRLWPGRASGRISTITEGKTMTPSTEAELRARIAELEAQNAALQRSLEFVRQDRKELREELYKGLPPSPEMSEEEEEKLYLEMLKNHVPGSGMKFLESLGLYPLRKA